MCTPASFWIEPYTSHSVYTHYTYFERIVPVWSSSCRHLKPVKSPKLVRSTRRSQAHIEPQWSSLHLLHWLSDPAPSWGTAMKQPHRKIICTFWLFVKSDCFHKRGIIDDFTGSWSCWSLSALTHWHWYYPFSDLIDFEFGLKTIDLRKPSRADLGEDVGKSRYLWRQIWRWRLWYECLSCNYSWMRWSMNWTRSAHWQFVDTCLRSRINLTTKKAHHNLAADWWPAQ